MKRTVLYIAGFSILLLAAVFVGAPHTLAVTKATRNETATVSPEPTPSATPLETPDPDSEDVFLPVQNAESVVSVADRLRKNLYLDQPTLHLVSMGGAIYLYPEPTTKSKRVKLVNENTRGASEFVVLAEVTSAEGREFYQVRSTFSHDTGYVLVKDTHESRLAKTGVSGYARIEAAVCELVAEPKEKSRILARECEHMVRILGIYKDYYYVITEAGNYGFVLPAQLVLIDEAEVAERVARAELPFVLETMNDPMPDASAANAAKMLRAGTDSAAVRYWTTAEAHVAQQGWLKKATVAMLTASAGGDVAPVGREGIQFHSCNEVPPITEGTQLQQGLDFNLHGSIYTDSPITSLTAELAPTGEGKAIRETVNFLPENKIFGYSLTSKVEPVGGKALDTLFDISRMRVGQYRFTLTVTTVAHPDAYTLFTANCEIIDLPKHVLTQNKFDDNFLDANEFFGGDTEKFLFPFTFKGGRGIATDATWRDAHIVVSSLGRVHIDAVPYFEKANHYLENTYVRVSTYNARYDRLSEGEILLLKDLMEKAVTYVPRFQSNLEYISHHTLGTAIDVNDTMYPNYNKRSHHELIGNDVKNHLTYNGIQTDETGRNYYDFTYDGIYPARYLKVPKTIINYLLYELAFYRAGFEWGYYYETTCDAMHFMLTENDRNRHMHTDIGLRKVYEYIEPEWVYVPTPSPVPSDTPSPDASLTPTAPAPTPQN